MKMRIKRVAANCISVEMNMNELHAEGGKAVLFLNLSETMDAECAFLDALSVYVAELVTECEALDMLPEVQESCNGSYGSTGMECDKCDRYKDDCDGSGEFL